MIIRIIFLIQILTGYLFSQNTFVDLQNINAFYGIGNNHLMDEYISKNEYTGVSYSELHTYLTGGHGYGLAKNGGTESVWPAACENWLRAGKYCKFQIK